jgi:predicted flap endonuclease-1-like 5' DNA nuclease
LPREIERPKIHSGFIISAMIIFFPIGIVLLLIRFAAHYKYNHLRAKDYTLVGHSFMILFGWFALIVLLATADTNTAGDVTGILVVLFIFLGLPGVFFYILGSNRKKKMNNLYNLYEHLTTVQGIEKFDRLAELTGENVRNVTQDLEYMIRSERLADATLDMTYQQIRLGHRSVQPEGQTDAATAIAEQARSQQQAAAGRAAASTSSRPAPVSITCPGCGSTSRVVQGESRDCEFCGNVLHIPASSR